MTIRELKCAIDGFEELKREQFDENMMGHRKTCQWIYKVWTGKHIDESKVFPLEIDTEIRRAKIRSMKPIEVTYG